jgi:cell division protease FtsH
MPASPKSTSRFNPRGGDRHGQRPLGGRPSSTLWYGLAFLLVLALAQMYYMTPTGRSIAYSDFKALVKNGQVAEVTISDQVIRGALKQAPANDPKGSKQFTVTRVEDPKLTEELEAMGVKYTGETANRWLPDLLSWIVPLIFFIGIWGFFFRRMRAPKVVSCPSRAAARRFTPTTRSRSALLTSLALTRRKMS